MKSIKKFLTNKRFLFGGIILVIFLASYFYKISERTDWGVEQSFMFWSVKKVAVDHQFTLIGSHFFSLVQGPIYRTPYFDWIVSLPMLVFGYRIAYLNFFFAGASFLGLVFFFGAMKHIGGEKVGYLAALLYSSSWFIRTQAMQLWNVALMIFLMCLVVCLLFRQKKQPSFSGLVILGFVVGAGFSLHMVVIWLAASILTYWLVFDRARFLRNSFFFTLGAMISLLPLIVFNFRHDFIMKRGVINLLTGQNVSYQADVVARLKIMTSTGGSLISETLGLGGHVWKALVALVILVWLAWRQAPDKSRRFIGFSLITIAVTLVGIYLSGRTNFSTLHYGLHLLPLIMGILAISTNNLLNSWLKPIGVLVLVYYLAVNLQQFVNYRVESGLVAKSKIAESIYRQPKPGVIAVRFTQEDVLSYDAIFYDAATRLKLPYNRVSLLERWSDGQADMEIPEK